MLVVFLRLFPKMLVTQSGNCERIGLMIAIQMWLPLVSKKIENLVSRMAEIHYIVLKSWKIIQTMEKD